MDIQRDPRKNPRRFIVPVLAGGILVAAVVGLNSLRTAATVIDRSLVTFDTVSFGELVREVRAPGILTPERVRLLVASTGGRVEELPVVPGAPVHPATLVVRLSNPDVALAALQTEQQLVQAYSSLAQLRSRLSQDRSSQQGLLATLRTQRLDAERSARVLDSLDRRGLASRNEVTGAHERAQELTARTEIEQHRMDEMRGSESEQLVLTQRQIEGLQRIVAEQRQRVNGLQVVAGETGQLQTLGNPKLELGSWVNSGTELARITDLGRLRVQLRVPEVEAKDIVPGQRVAVDTHEGIVRGHVVGVDPMTRGGAVLVDVALDEALPRGARADLAVEGSIEIERLPPVVRVGRPAYGRAGSVVHLFRVIPNTGEAERVDVLLGKTSATMVEVTRGLARGDSVIISDMMPYVTDTRIHLRGT